MFFKYFNGESLLLPKLAMKIGGVWPSDRPKRVSLIVFVISSSLLIANSMIGLIAFYQNGGSSVDNLMKCVSPLVVFLKCLTIRLNSDRLVCLIEWKINDWSLGRNPKERQIMKRDTVFGATFFVVWLLNYLGVTTFRLIWFFPFYHDIKFSVQKQIALNDHYARVLVTKAFLWVMMYSHFLIAYGTIMLFWSLNTHLVGQFRILKKHFQQFLRIKNKDRSHRRFRRLVDRHNELLNLSDELEKSFSVFLATEVMVSQIFICFHAYHLAVANLNGNLIELASAINSFAFHAWFLFVIYYSGECLTTCSEEIGDVFKGCKWYNLSKDSRLNFSIVILQSQRPKKLTTAGLYKLNLSNYKYMVQSVYSYISLILAITKNEV